MYTIEGDLIEIPTPKGFIVNSSFPAVNWIYQEEKGGATTTTAEEVNESYEHENDNITLLPPEEDKEDVSATSERKVGPKPGGNVHDAYRTLATVRFARPMNRWECYRFEQIFPRFYAASNTHRDVLY
jgi:hypothetical protein